MEQGAMQPTFQSVRLNDILSPLVSEYSLQARRANLSFRVRLLADVVVNTDATYLRRIVQNFVSNAVKYTPQGGVLLAVRRRHAGVLISVYDTGSGIHLAEKEKVFDAFIRLHDSGTSGLGLGLAVAKRMAHQLNASIDLNSRPGRGSCFSVLVPLGNEQALIETAVQPQDQVQLDPMLVLCVDDEPKNLVALTALLEKWGCQTQCFDRPDDALNWARKHNTAPDLMLLDYQLGHTFDGLKLAAELRLIWQEEIPAALVTAMDDEQLRQTAKELKIPVLNKPIKPAKLRSFLRSAASLKQRSDKPSSSETPHGAVDL
jgi:CheY-like chemotaxis protein